MGGSGRCVKSPLAHLKDLDSVVPIHVWKLCLMLSEPLFENFSPMNGGIVILEYACASREEETHWWKNLVIQYIQVVSWPKLFQKKEKKVLRC